MELAIAGGSSRISVNDTVFDRPFSEALVHQVVVAYLAGARAGTKGQKNRSAVAGGGRKPYKQKGSGNARAGTIRSPIWRGGGKTFAATPRDHSQKVNRKMYRGAISAILSELVRQERLIVVEEFALAEQKTRALIEKLAGFEFDQGLIVDAELDTNLFLASRNLPGVYVVTVDQVDPVSLVGSEKVIVTTAAITKIQEWLA
ncbi:MAG: 50S ribosomal protein L4 [Gammaproteobacteria bacterium HGW-Gammaproteobacteria-8]|nr:MAG: 50S ribosomal protein L4 [Gammaproteobacteria bacterium HGW-Gammaproteobacteria-8]